MNTFRAVRGDSPDISALKLVLGWKDQDPNTRMLAEVIASGLSSHGSLEANELYCPPSGFRGRDYDRLWSLQESETSPVCQQAKRPVVQRGRALG